MPAIFQEMGEGFALALHGVVPALSVGLCTLAALCHCSELVLQFFAGGFLSGVVRIWIRPSSLCWTG